VPAIGTSLFLIEVGAILRYAVTATVTGVSLPTVGLILMIVGVAGLILSLSFIALHIRESSRGSRDRAVENQRRRYR
jgi:uncharacterized membrane protein YuzA (DUF378 family)